MPSPIDWINPNAIAARAQVLRRWVRELAAAAYRLDRHPDERSGPRDTAHRLVRRRVRM